MNKIKKYYKIIIGALVSLFGIIFVISQKNSKKQIEKLDKKIDDKKNKTTELDGRIKEVNRQKIDSRKKIIEAKEEIQKTKQNKKDYAN